MIMRMGCRIGSRPFSANQAWVKPGCRGAEGEGNKSESPRMYD